MAKSTRKKVKTELSKSEKNLLADAATLGQALQQRDAQNKALDTIMEALGAVKYVWDKDSQAHLPQPDFVTRLKAAELLMAYAWGLPVERQEIVQETHHLGEKELSARIKQVYGIPTDE